MSRYLLKFQFFGFRYHGWMLQPNVKTVQGQINKTLQFIFPHLKIKTLACGRTDAMVSANEHYVELYLESEIDCKNTLEQMQLNLPQDIRLLSIDPSKDAFQIIQDVQSKEYHYLFTDEEEAHPFCSGMMTKFRQALDIKRMQAAASLFVGEHCFESYCYRAKNSEKKEFTRKVEGCQIIIKPSDYTASFFPQNYFLLKVIGKGFMRHQVRMMMGALILVGEGKWDIEMFQESLKTGNELKPLIAPASGLILNQVKY